MCSRESKLSPVPVWSDDDCAAFRLVGDRDVDWSDLAVLNHKLEQRYRNGDVDGEPGAHIKEFLIDDSCGDVWMAKSGALYDPKAHHSLEIERIRRVAFPLNEALVPLLLNAVGVNANRTALGIRTMAIVPPNAEDHRLRVSFHQMQKATRGDKSSSAADLPLLTDIACMCCIDLIVGQEDRRRHNYMITAGGQLLPIDHQACLTSTWLEIDRTTTDFDRIFPSDLVEFKGWTKDIKERVVARMAPHTPQLVDATFDSLPPDWVEHHDLQLNPEYFAENFLRKPMRVKKERVKQCLKVFAAWAVESCDDCAGFDPGRGDFTDIPPAPIGA